MDFISLIIPALLSALDSAIIILPLKVHATHNKEYK